MSDIRWVYVETEAGLWTVGHYDPTGAWIPSTDYHDEEKAAARTHWLNGGREQVSA